MVTPRGPRISYMYHLKEHRKWGPVFITNIYGNRDVTVRYNHVFSFRTNVSFSICARHFRNCDFCGFQALTEAQRDQLLEKVLVNNSYIGWAITILSPK